MQKILSFLLSFIIFVLNLCGAFLHFVSDDIIVLFTNDVHCALTENTGYDGVAALKREEEQKSAFVTLVDCGDHTQGSYIGAVSKGECAIDIMNEVGYDYAVLGNHEFDYGLEQLQSNIERLDAEYLCCNYDYTGSGKNALEDVKPYEIEQYGLTKVAFIGISTPLTPINTTAVYFTENGEYVYSFAEGENGRIFFDRVQQTVDECREQGADYVVALAHLGIESEAAPYTSYDLIENTSGLDAVLDGHSHSTVECEAVTDKCGDTVLLSQTGTGLENVGELVIPQDGSDMSVSLISDYEKKDEKTAEYIDDITAVYEEQMNTVAAKSNTDLLLGDKNGIRMIRSREMPLGNLVADAYRTVGNADIGLCNGGGIRADLRAGDITYSDIIAVNPYGNTLCVMGIPGSEILDMLEYFYRSVKPDYVKDGLAFGEDGSFQQISGLKLTVNTSIPSSVVTDDMDMFVSVAGERRVSDVYVLQNGEYVPLDPEKTYTVASHNYLLKNGGCGMANLLMNRELLVNDTVADYQVLIDYITSLGGDLSQYKAPEGRITVK